MTDPQLKEFLGGFQLVGDRQPDGTLKAHGGNTVIADWPEEVTILGITFALEDVDKQPGMTHEEGIYV
jgi:hypothetical protein